MSISNNMQNTVNTSTAQDHHDWHADRAIKTDSGFYGFERNTYTPEVRVVSLTSEGAREVGRYVPSYESNERGSSFKCVIL